MYLKRKVSLSDVSSVVESCTMVWIASVHLFPEPHPPLSHVLWTLLLHALKASETRLGNETTGSLPLELPWPLVAHHLTHINLKGTTLWALHWLGLQSQFAKKQKNKTKNKKKQTNKKKKTKKQISSCRTRWSSVIVKQNAMLSHQFCIAQFFLSNWCEEMEIAV